MLNIFDLRVKVMKFTRDTTAVTVAPLGKLIPFLKHGFIYFEMLSVFPGEEEV